MNHCIHMELCAATSEEGFSLDELVIGLKKLMHEKGLPGILELVLNHLDEHITLELMRCGSMRRLLFSRR